MSFPEIHFFQRSEIGESGQAGSALLPGCVLYRRTAWLGLLFTLEIVFLSTWLDTQALLGSSGLRKAIGDWGAAGVRSLVAMAAVFVALASVRSRSALERISESCLGSGVRWNWLAGHILAISVFCALSAQLYGAMLPGAPMGLIAALWLICGGLAVALGGFAFFPPRAFYRFFRDTGPTWAYAALAGILVNPFASVADRLWNPAANLTFWLVRLCLKPFVHDLIANPATKLLGTRNFRVLINPQCSGLEGAGLMILFGAFWLWFLRDELRFPRVLVVIPAGVVILYCLNAVRIAALLLLGDMGAKRIALGGFHSQAGWMAFNAVALGLLLGVRYVPWLTTKAPEQTRTASAENPAAPYLIPFLVILAAAMVARAASAKFEWLYPLRFLAAATALWIFRRKYATLSWRTGWWAPLIGALAFLIWLTLHRFAGVQPDNGIAAGLRNASFTAGVAWLVFRVLAAVVTVPLAEELAFRGFLIRRIVSADFESVSATKAAPLAIALSSIVFGAMHGGNWVAGTLVGVLYALCLIHRGRIGDAVAAHATTNALLAAWVLIYRDWSLW